MPSSNEVQPSRAVTGCVLVPVLFLAVLFSVVTVGVVVVTAIGGPKGPLASLAPALTSLAISGLLAAFFAMVARRMIASLRGRPVPHLFPPLVGVVVGGGVGLLALGTGFAAIAGVNGTSGGGRSIGLGVLCLGYAGQQIRAWYRRRKAKAAEAREEQPPARSVP